MSVNESKADAVRVFLQEDGIVVEFAGEATAAINDGKRLESVAKVLLPAATFHRMGLALQDAVRKLPPDTPATPSGPPARRGAPAYTGTAPRTTPAPEGSSKRQPPPSVAAGTRRVEPGPGQAVAVKRQPPASPPTGAVSVDPEDASTYRVSLRDAPNTSKKPALEYMLEPTIDMASSKAAPSVAGEISSRLLEVVRNLGAPYVQERSFRIRRQELLPNRFLLSVGRPDDGSASDEAILDAFATLGLPEPFMKATQENIGKARCIHFGFEGDAGKPLLKVYLEVAGNIESTGGGEGAVLEHLAYKWDPTNEERAAVGRYFWYPKMTADQIRARVDKVYGGASPDSREIAHAVVELAAARMPATDIHYLEIEEDGNDRRSYSINFYDADMKVRDLQPLLNRMRSLFDVEPARFQILYDQIKVRRFGHLAGGVHRNGRDFFNLYYGPEFFDQGAAGEWRESLLRTGSSAPAKSQ